MKSVARILMLAGLAAAETCKTSYGFTGTCTTVSSCNAYGGTHYSGYCSGGSDNQCCTNVPCGENGEGMCVLASECTGTAKTGLCPGDADYVCCTGMKCRTGAGVCKMDSHCSGATYGLECPGSKSFRCCVESERGDNRTVAQGIVDTALSQVGQWPYAWGGGDDSGPTYGVAMGQSPYCDDSGTLGFDCSGLAKYSVYQGTGWSIYHKAQVQYTDGPHIELSQRKPGDLVFFGSSKSNIWHVAIYIGNDEIVEAPGHYSDCSGMPMRRTALYWDNLIDEVARYW